ncbi:hypothetical protein TNCV_1357041 [Trichonephila clavipes]|uniref:Uncharacterized protein n=1 Tax=Trichonephila clavipes TaxID=2585209 RepID=A0A8X6S6D7_TRICX|nr:hypothetical protein TNCV_1357041 [Trichonephila clavipes]
MYPSKLFNPLTGHLPPEKLFRKRLTLILRFPSKMQQTFFLSPFYNLGGRTGKILRPSSVALKSKNQEINRLQLAVKLPWAIFFESVDILS